MCTASGHTENFAQLSRPELLQATADGSVIRVIRRDVAMADKKVYKHQ